VTDFSSGDPLQKAGSVFSFGAASENARPCLERTTAGLLEDRAVFLSDYNNLNIFYYDYIAAAGQTASSTTMPASYRNCSSAERRQDYQRADARANPASWKHVNLYGAYSFLDIGDGVDLQELVNLLEAARGRGAAAPD
jgi:hypothetical protein